MSCIISNEKVACTHCACHFYPRRSSHQVWRSPVIASSRSDSEGPLQGCDVSSCSVFFYRSLCELITRLPWRSHYPIMQSFINVISVIIGRFTGRLTDIITTRGAQCVFYSTWYCSYSSLFTHITFTLVYTCDVDRVYIAHIHTLTLYSATGSDSSLVGHSGNSTDCVIFIEFISFWHYT